MGPAIWFQVTQRSKTGVSDRVRGSNPPKPSQTNVLTVYSNIWEAQPSRRTHTYALSPSQADTAGRSALSAPPVAPRKQVRGTFVTGGARMAVQHGAAVVPTATRASVRDALSSLSVTPAGRRALHVH